MPLVPFYVPEYIKKRLVLLLLSEGIERDQWHEMGKQRSRVTVTEQVFLRILPDSQESNYHWVPFKKDSKPLNFSFTQKGSCHKSFARNPSNFLKTSCLFWVMLTKISFVRSSHQRCSAKKVFLEFHKIYRKTHLCQSLFFNKVAGLFVVPQKVLWRPLRPS